MPVADVDGGTRTTLVSEKPRKEMNPLLRRHVSIFSCVSVSLGDWIIRSVDPKVLRLGCLDEHKTHISSLDISPHFRGPK